MLRPATPSSCPPLAFLHSPLAFTAYHRNGTAQCPRRQPFFAPLRIRPQPPPEPRISRRSPMPEEAELASEISLIHGMYINNLVTTSFVSLLIFDYLLTFDAEVTYIWSQRFNFGKVLFCLNRYIPMLDLITLWNSYVNRGIKSDKFCAPFFHVDSWIGMFSIFTVNVILLLRTWAIWGKSRVVLGCLATLLMLCTIAQGGAAIYADIVVQNYPVPGNVRPCATNFERTDVLYAIWISSIVWDTVILVMGLVKLLPLVRPNILGSKMLARLMKDGTTFFAALFLCSVANVITLNLAAPALKTMMFTFYRVMLSLLASRIILNLRGVLLKSETDADMANVELTKVNVFTTTKRVTIGRSAPTSPVTPNRGFFRPSYLHSELMTADEWKEDETNYAASIKSEAICEAI